LIVFSFSGKEALILKDGYNWHGGRDAFCKKKGVKFRLSQILQVEHGYIKKGIYP